jgi:hypothetical protein
VATTAVLSGVATALAGAAVWRVVNEGRLLLFAGLMDGQALAPLLWLVTGLCAIVLGVVGFRLFVIGYEAFTAAMAALFLCAVILAAAVGVLVMGILTLLPAEHRYVTLRELDRPVGHQVVIMDTGSTYGPSWRFYVGGPFLYDEVPASSTTVAEGSAECARYLSARRTVFVHGEYLLRADSGGGDVITFSPEGRRTCDHDGVAELVLPE